MRNPGEACDDGNITDGDGCSADCLIEKTCYLPIDNDKDSCYASNTSQLFLLQRDESCDSQE